MNDKYKKAMDEKESLNKKSLGKIDPTTKPSNLKEQQDRINNLIPPIKPQVNPTTSIGWYNLSVDSLITKGMFYPADLIIQIRSAELPEIEHYSTMVETDIVSVTKHLNDIIKSCCKVYSKSVPNFTVMDLCETDKTPIVLHIRDLTFPEPERNITYQLKCPTCSTSGTYKLASNMMSGKLNLPTDIEKYYNAQKRCITLNTRSFGEIDIKLPTLWNSEYTYNLVRENARKQESTDETFFQMFPYLYSNLYSEHSDESIEKFRQEYRRTNTIKRYNLIYNIIKKIDESVDTNLHVKCVNKDCTKGEFETRFRLTDGWRSLFIVSDFSDELI